MMYKYQIKMYKRKHLCNYIIIFNKYKNNAQKT